MEDEEYDYQDQTASEGEIASDGGPEEYYQTVGGTQDAPSPPATQPSPDEALAGYAEPRHQESVLEKQLPSGLGEGSPQFGVTPNYVTHQLDDSRLRSVLQETAANNDKRRYEEQVGRGEFSPQDSQRLQRMNWGRSYVEGEVDAGRMTHRDGLRALQDIDRQIVPLQERKSQTEAQAKNERYKKAMEDPKFAALVESQNAELEAKDVRRHLTPTPDGGFVYTGKGLYHAPPKKEPEPEFDTVKNWHQAEAEAKAFVKGDPGSDSYKKSVQDEAQAIYERRMQAFNSKLPDRIAGPLNAGGRPQLSDVPAEEFLRQQNQAGRMSPRMGGSYDDISRGAAPNPSPQQASNEYAAIQRSYPGGASTIKDQRLVQRVIQLRRIMGMK